MSENLSVKQDLSSPIVQTIGGEPWQYPVSSEDSSVIGELRTKFGELDLPLILIEDPLNVRVADIDEATAHIKCVADRLAMRIRLRGLVDRAKVAREAQEHEAKIAREDQEHEAKMAREARERQFQREQNDADHHVQLQLNREKKGFSGTSLVTQHIKQQSISGQIGEEKSVKVQEAAEDAGREDECQGLVDVHVTEKTSHPTGEYDSRKALDHFRQYASFDSSRHFKKTSGRATEEYHVRELPMEIPLRYQTDGRWGDKGIKLSNVLFGWDTKTFYDDILRNRSKEISMSWGGRPDELAPRDFLEELVAKIEYDDASPKGFFQFILFHLDEGMRFLAKNHVRENLHEDERNARLLCLWDFILNVRGKECPVDHVVVESVKQGNMSAEGYFEVWSRLIEEVRRFRTVSKSDGLRFEKFWAKNLSLYYRLRWQNLDDKKWTFLQKKERLVQEDENYSINVEEHYLPSGLHRSEELLVRENIFSMALGRKIRHESVRDLSVVSQKDVDIRYRSFVQDPFAYVKPAREGKSYVDKITTVKEKKEIWKPKTWKNDWKEKDASKDAVKDYSKEGMTGKKFWKPLEELECYICHKKGHLANKCPEKKTIGKRTESKSEKPAEMKAKYVTLENWSYKSPDYDGDLSESPHVKRADPVFYSLRRNAEIDPSKDIPASVIQSSVDFGLLERLEFEEAMIDDKSAEKFSRSEAMKRFSSPPVLKRWKIKGKDNQIKDLIVMWDSGAGTNVMNEEMADDLINTGFGVGHPIEPIKLSGISGVPNLIKKELIVDVVKGNSAERIALLISSSSGITVPLISTKTLEILDQLRDEKEENWKIQDASGYSLYLRRLEFEEKKDNEEQLYVFEIDWDFEKEMVVDRIWDPKRLIDKLSNEERESYFNEIAVYIEKGLWTRDPPSIAPNAVCFPVVQNQKTTKVRPVLDCRCLNSRLPPASMSKVSIHQCVAELQAHGWRKKIRIYDIKRAFYSIRLRKYRVGINTGKEILSSNRLVFGLAIGPAALRQALNIILAKVQVKGCKHVRFGDDILVMGSSEYDLDSWENLMMIETKKCGFEIPEVKIVRPMIGQVFRWLGMNMKFSDSGLGFFRREFTEIPNSNEITKRDVYRLCGDAVRIVRSLHETHAASIADQIRGMMTGDLDWDQPLPNELGITIVGLLENLASVWNRQCDFQLLEMQSSSNLVLCTDSSKIGCGWTLSCDNKLLSSGMKRFTQSAKTGIVTGKKFLVC